MKSKPSDSSRPPSAARAWLHETRAAFERDRLRAAARESRWAWGRLGVFLLAIPPWFILTGEHQVWAVVATLLVAVLFVLTVRRHLVLLARRDAASRCVLVADEAIGRCDGHVTCVRSAARPADCETEDQALPLLLNRGLTWPLSAQERDDMDLYSPPVGLFGLLNRASSEIGARRLRDTLENPMLEADRITARQAAVRWLAEHGEPRLRLMAAAAALRREDRRLSALITAVHAAQPLTLPVPASAVRLWALASLILVVVIISQLAGGNLGWLGPGVVLLAVNGTIQMRNRGKLRDALEPWQDIAWAARGALITTRQAAEELPEETELTELRNACRAAIAPDVLPHLWRRLNWTGQGGPVWAVCNLVCFADTHVAHAILKCVVQHRATLLRGLSAIAELDMLSSLASFAAEQPVTSYPEVARQTGVTITGGRHPLVPPERVIANDAELTPACRLWIITGSNMAGKSTFLRMVGVNVLLAQVGCVVPAERMQWSPVRLITDLQARDNLAEQESYFLAEVRHLRRMVLPPQGDTPVLGLMDEPFRGTNSEDQTAASVAVVRHLLASGHIFLLATHDRHLTKLADDSAARNFHFCEHLGSDGLVFDYRLHDGPATSRNALRVLEREGYPKEVVATAHRWLQESRHD